MKPKARMGSFLMILILCFVPFSFLLPVSAQTTTEPVLEFNYGITTKSDSLFKRYDNESWYYTYEGNDSHAYSYDYDSYWGGDGYYYVEEHQYTGNVEYEDMYNKTVSGYFKMDMTLDMYEVEITYGDQLKVLVYALKNGTFYVEHSKNYSKTEHIINQTVHTTERKVLKKYEDELRETLISEELLETNEFDNTWQDNDTYCDCESQFMNQTGDLSLPLILISQIVTTNNGQRFAWNELIWDYFIYNDTNEDGFYTVNMDLYQSEQNTEMVGTITPFICEVTHEMDGHGYSMKYPNDTLIEDAFPLIDFTPPVEKDGKISWGIDYKNFPTFASALPYYPSDFHDQENLRNKSYADCPKSNYTYEFDFTLDKTGSQLDLTSGIGVVDTPEDEFYYAMEGFDLCLPHITYFLSSEKIEQELPSIMSIGQESFVFESNGEKVAEIDMSSEKKPYILYNASDNDKPLVFNSVGASVSKLITSKMEGAMTTLGDSSGATIWNLIFSIEGDVKNDPLLGSGANPSRLFTIETQNYPIWDGNGIYHDPSFKVYFGEDSETTDDETTPDENGDDTNGDGEDDSPSDPPSIGIPNIIGIAGALFVGVIISIYYGKERIKNI